MVPLWYFSGTNAGFLKVLLIFGAFRANIRNQHELCNHLLYDPDYFEKYKTFLKPPFPLSLFSDVALYIGRYTVVLRIWAPAHKPLGSIVGLQSNNSTTSAQWVHFFNKINTSWAHSLKNCATKIKTTSTKTMLA